jgi:PAS domain S-box-containing protein
MILRGAPVGFVGFDSVHTDKEWSDDETSLLKMAGEIFVNALERKRIEEALQASEERFRALIENAADAVVVVDPQGIVKYRSPAVGRMLGYTDNYALQETVFERTHPEDQATVIEEFQHLLHSPGELGSPLIFRFRHIDGSWRTLEAVGKNLLDDPRVQGVVVNYRDVTEREQAQAKLRESLSEKEVLLKELHHRVKNNLQVVSSLISLQSQHVTDPRARQMLQETQNRVMSMAILHRGLYGSKNISRIDCADYVSNVVAQVFSSYGDASTGIKVKTDVAQISVGIDVAIPCGLIVSELVSNCLMHAFPKGGPGEVLVDLHTTSHNKLTLNVSDNGAGFPTDVDFRNTESLGLQLVNALTGQLGGTVDLVRNGGTTFSITFPKVKHAVKRRRDENGKDADR